MAAFIRWCPYACPNGKKPVLEIQANDFIYLDGRPCRMSDPPNITHLEGLSGAGYEDPRDEKSILVRAPSVFNGEECGQLYSLNAEVPCFVDKHEEHIWLFVCKVLRSCRAGHD